MWKRLATRLARRITSVPEEVGQRSSSDGRRLVFVGGVPRSGTTLVQHILDSHPLVFGGPEFDCVPSIVGSWRNVTSALGHGRIRAYCDQRQIDSAFIALIENLLLPAADACGAQLLSEKTPFNLYVFPDLLELFPRCRAVHIVRDPRAVIASLFNVSKRARAQGADTPPWAKDIGEAIDMMRQALKRGFQAAKQYPDRMFTLSYETLISQPELIIRQLCSFLGIAFHSSMLEPHAQKHPEQDALLRFDNGTWVDPNLGLRAIESSRLQVWRQDLQPDQIAAINDAFRDHTELRDLGYTFA